MTAGIDFCYHWSRLPTTSWWYSTVCNPRQVCDTIYTVYNNKNHGRKKLAVMSLRRSPQKSHRLFHMRTNSTDTPDPADLPVRLTGGTAIEGHISPFYSD